MSEQEVRSGSAGCWAIVPWGASLALGFFVLSARIESFEDLAVIRAADVLLGGTAAAGVRLIGGERRSKLATFGPAAVAWLVVSGSLLLWHGAQTQARLDAARRATAEGGATMVRIALQEYAQDCGGFPAGDQGLSALFADPGVPGWAGPYLGPEGLRDPWGNPFRFRVRGERVEVWSDGPDGVSGTGDDIRSEVADRDRGER